MVSQLDSNPVLNASTWKAKLSSSNSSLLLRRKSKQPFSKTVGRQYFQRLHEISRTSPLYDSYKPLNSNFKIKSLVNYERSISKTEPKRRPSSDWIFFKSKEQNSRQRSLEKSKEGKESLNVVGKRTTGFVDFKRQVLHRPLSKPPGHELDLNYEISEQNSKFKKTILDIYFQQFCVEKFEARKNFAQQRFFYDKKFDFVERKLATKIPDFEKGPGRGKLAPSSACLFEGYYDVKKSSNENHARAFEGYVQKRNVKL